MTIQETETPFGNIIIGAHQDKLVYCNWNEEECQRKLKKVLKIKNNLREKEITIIENTIRQLKEYFSGTRRNFSIKYELNGTPFQIKVWEGISDLEYGTTMTYKELAQKIGHEGSCRAVAQACGANPIALIIPCHRIISLRGTGGYTGGLEKKRSLLRMESNNKSGSYE